MNSISLSADRCFAEGCNSGVRCVTAPVAVYGMRGAVEVCGSYLRASSGGPKPTVAQDLQVALAGRPEAESGPAHG